MARGIFLAASALATLVAALQVDPKGRAEVHPILVTQKCTKSGGCKSQNTKIVLDQNFHNPHAISGSGSCANGAASVCPDKATCAKNCAVEGADYPGNGVTTSGSSLKLDMFVNKGGVNTAVSPRVYLLNEKGDEYEMLQLNGREFTFDVDNSKLPCGMNGALYTSEMDPKGGMGQYNKAGAAYGTGYCDAQCFVTTWFNGELNANKNGVCCQEMDLWEGNSRAQMFTPHPCKTTGPFACSGTACDQPGTCDKWGCGYNAYRAGNKNFYGPGMTLDSSKPMTVVTQFHTSDKTTNGTLVEIRRLYVQNGKKFGTDALPKTTDGFTANSLTTPYCDVYGTYTAVSGGLAEQGNALRRGSVLAMSIWYSEGDNMNWLDSGTSGPCSDTEGSPANIRQNNPTTSVTFSNIKWGEIDSTY